MCMSALYVCVPHGVQDAYKGRKMVLEPLELEQRLIVSHLLGSGNQIQVLQEQHVLLTTKS